MAASEGKLFVTSDGIERGRDVFGPPQEGLVERIEGLFGGHPLRRTNISLSIFISKENSGGNTAKIEDVKEIFGGGKRELENSRGGFQIEWKIDHRRDDDNGSILPMGLTCGILQKPQHNGIIEMMMNIIQNNNGIGFRNAIKKVL